MAKYRKLPALIEAEKVSDLIYGFSHDFKLLPDWVIEAYDEFKISRVTDSGFYINTLEGQLLATKEDYVIKGIDDELYPCKIEIFEKTYEQVGE